jgi:small glutamine-rich tetratricopeptide repeat-containing protein alpha
MSQSAQSSPAAAQDPRGVIFPFIEHLQDFLRENSSFEGAENVEVAIQCLSQAFNADLSSEEQRKAYSIKPHSLPAVLGGLRALRSLAPPSSPPSAPAPVSLSEPVETTEQKWNNFISMLKAKNYFGTHQEGTAEYANLLSKARERFQTKYGVSLSPSLSSAAAAPKNKEEAEKWKLTGNLKLADKQYQEAVQAYTKAIELDSENAIYYSNRAAAHSFLGNHENAILDSKEAVHRDPTFSKAYSRLGTAYFNLGYYNDAVKQYSKALQLDPSNPTLKESLQKASLKAADKPDQKPLPAHLQVEETSASSPPPPVASPSAAKPAAPGMPTMPDLSNFNMNNLGGMMNEMMSNPEFLQMAQQMMQNPAFMNMASSMMQNPGSMSNLFNPRGPGAAPQ